MCALPGTALLSGLKRRGRLGNLCSTRHPAVPWPLLECSTRRCPVLGASGDGKDNDRGEIDLGLQHEPVDSVLVLSQGKRYDDTLIGEGIHARHLSERPPKEVGIRAVVLEVLARPVISRRCL